MLVRQASAFRKIPNDTYTDTIIFGFSRALRLPGGVEVDHRSRAARYCARLTSNPSPIPAREGLPTLPEAQGSGARQLSGNIYNGARMALTPGTKLGPYEIQSPLGAGGMPPSNASRRCQTRRKHAASLVAYTRISNGIPSEAMLRVALLRAKESEGA